MSAIIEYTGISGAASLLQLVIWRRRATMCDFVGSHSAIIENYHFRTVKSWIKFYTWHRFEFSVLWLWNLKYIVNTNDWQCTPNYTYISILNVSRTQQSGAYHNNVIKIYLFFFQFGRDCDRKVFVKINKPISSCHCLCHFFWSVCTSTCIYNVYSCSK